jgi:hypothetical protein
MVECFFRTKFQVTLLHHDTNIPICAAAYFVHSVESYLDVHMIEEVRSFTSQMGYYHPYP